MEGSLHKNHEDQIAGKDVNSLSHYNLVHKFISFRIVGVEHPIKLKQDLRVFWKLVNLQDCVWKNHYRITMKIILQEKETLHCSITIWFTNLYLCLKP